MRSLFASLVSALVAGALALPTLAHAQGDPDGRLTIHGYLTQGYAVSDGDQFYGITSQPSTDFRVAALQFRYDRKQDGFLVQLNNRRLGRSPITDFESAVNVNWAFYEHRTDDGSTLRVGRVPVPRGIYNERRNIGVVLPFYRAPVIFYDEGAYFSETIDGVVASHDFFRDASWSLESHLYAGGWSLLQYDQSGPEYNVSRVRAENAVGGQLWLNTPAEGVRVGAAAQTYHWIGLADGSSQHVSEYQASLDATRTYFMLRAETELMHYETDHYYSSYVQGGVNLTSKLSLNTEVEYAVERDWKLGTYPDNFEWHRAAGLGLNYKISPTLVLKAEQHWNKGIQVEEHADPVNPPRFTYAIASLSASF